jgi:hypothetical protein
MFEGSTAKGSETNLRCDLRLRSSPAVIALPDVPGNLPLKRPRSTLMSKREFQEVPRVDFAWESGIGTP